MYTERVAEGTMRTFVEFREKPFLDDPCAEAHLQTFTWKSVLGPCSLAGLSGATGLRLLQKCMLESSGLGVRRSPLGV